MFSDWVVRDDSMDLFSVFQWSHTNCKQWVEYSFYSDSRTHEYCNTLKPTYPNILGVRYDRI